MQWYYTGFRSPYNKIRNAESHNHSAQLNLCLTWFLWDKTVDRLKGFSYNLQSNVEPDNLIRHNQSSNFEHW